MKKSLSLLFALIIPFIISAKDKFIITIDSVDSHEAAGNYYSYPYMNTTPPQQTEPPVGYVPYHIEHYGRHGSRWHIGNYNYQKTYELLTKAHKDEKLTSLGENLLSIVTEIREEFLKGRDGELSDKGAIQHFMIGERMANNFPEVFNSIANIDARSTIVIRCILSMQNSLKGIQSRVPSLNVKTDASYADMWYMNYDDSIAWKIKEEASEIYLKPFLEKHKNKGKYFSRLFTDVKYAQDSIGDDLAKPLFNLLVNMQSHNSQPWLLDSIFNIQEIHELWIGKNANWFMRAGNSKLTDNRIPFSQKNLLLNIIESADTALNTVHPSANLRYGHDSVLFPLAVLMEIDDFGREINDLEELAITGWHDYLVVPMGANLQMIFYRPEREKIDIEDIIVKVMLNEREVALPVKNVTGPYYRWKDLRDYYISKLN